MDVLEQVKPETGDANRVEAQKFRSALDNLRKQHLWGDVPDEEYRLERAALERRLKLIDKPPKPREIPNLERAAQLLKNLSGLWDHPGVTDDQWEALLEEVFQRVTIDGKTLTSIEPKLVYQPLFACILTSQESGYREFKSPPSPQ